MEPLLFIISALILGALTRHLLKKMLVPYTVLLLLIGLLLGTLTRLDLLPGFLEEFGKALEWAGKIDPHVVLFVFLPTLVFEAAFGMDWHTFRKTSVNATLLAVPGIIIALLATAAVLVGIKISGIGLSSWTWPMALMFGAVISATDPVAVVAILKELGASKKLSTLIDGESILNDGTAIVLFMVFYIPLTGIVNETNPLLDFLFVSMGGIALGLLVARLVMYWLKMVINDALVEISIILAAAYLTFFVAEHFIHVSGVLALFGFGITMASIGKTRISPGVKHFLGEFLELAVYIANTLIFTIVGVVIASRVNFTLMDFFILIILYTGIHVARALMLGLLFPFLRKSGYGLTLKEAIVTWYGALRGAVGLALALIVAGTDRIPPDIRDQFLFFTAGIVVLTLLINATTVKFIVDRLGMTKLSPSRVKIINGNQGWLMDQMMKKWNEVTGDRFFKIADQERVKSFLPLFNRNTVDTASEEDQINELRRLLLEKEKVSYWDQFNRGMMNAETVVKLSEAISELLDNDTLPPLHKRFDLEDLMRNSPFLSRIKKVKWMFNFYIQLNHNRLSLSYDFARAFVEAQSKNLILLDELEESAGQTGKDSQIYELLKEEIMQNLIHGQTFLRNFKKLHPLVSIEITTRQAAHALLDQEKELIDEMLKSGRIELNEADKLNENINERLRKLLKNK